MKRINYNKVLNVGKVNCPNLYRIYFSTEKDGCGKYKMQYVWENSEERASMCVAGYEPYVIRIG